MYFLGRLSVSLVLSLLCAAIVVFAAKTLDEIPNPPVVAVYCLMALGVFAIPFGLWHGLHRSQRVATTVRRRGTTTSALVREALEDRLAAEPGKSSSTCLDLCRDLVGSLSGPADLSSNPNRLKGYGR